jgi:hypothetical protein
MVTDPLDLILSRVALAAKTELAPANKAISAKVTEEIEASLFIFMYILLNAKELLIAV